MATASAVSVNREEAASSGFAMIVEQYLSQSLEESEDKQRRASKLNGRIAMTAEDYEQTVTLVFKGNTVDVVDGLAEPLDASIVGPYQTLVNLLQGDDNPLFAHLRRRVKVRSSLSKPFFPLHVHNLMKLDDESERTFVSDVRELAVAGAVLIAVAAAAFYAT